MHSVSFPNFSSQDRQNLSKLLTVDLGSIVVCLMLFVTRKFKRIPFGEFPLDWWLLEENLGKRYFCV
jgi:hypothetical protein